MPVKMNVSAMATGTCASAPASTKAAPGYAPLATWRYPMYLFSTAAAISERFAKPMIMSMLRKVP